MGKDARVGRVGGGRTLLGKGWQGAAPCKQNSTDRLGSWASGREDVAR